MCCTIKGAMSIRPGSPPGPCRGIPTGTMLLADPTILNTRLGIVHSVDPTGLNMRLGVAVSTYSTGPNTHSGAACWI